MNMDKEKQIEELTAIIADMPNSVDCIVAEAEYLYAKGYRKQSEGEWIKQVKVRKEGKPLLYYYQCSLCGVYLAEQANFCPNCGAKMKGGE